MKNIHFAIILLLFWNHSNAQNWNLKLKSRVELRTWRLTSVADKTEKSLGGALIVLQKGATILSQTNSDSNGDFEIDVPPNGEYILTITFAGCNTKKFSVSTNDVPENVGKDNYKPTVSIAGFVMAKPIKGVDYIGLNEPLVKVEYKGKGQNFDKDDAVTNKGLEIVSKIYDAETAAIEKFCLNNKHGDDALVKKNCPLAKEYYQKAIEQMPAEQYPHEQMKKVEMCLKNNENKKEAEMAEAAQKAEAAKLATDKIIEEKKLKDKEQFNKTEKNKLAKENNATEQKNKPVTELNTNTPTNENQMHDKGEGKYKMPGVIGADKYKETIKIADDYFKMKRYSEAKTAYTDALKFRANDAYATSRITEIEKLQAPK